MQKGTFLTVEAVEGDVVRLESGQSFAGPELLKHTRLCSAITYASVQGLTLRGRVGLYDVESPHFTLKHLYMGCSRATNSELLGTPNRARPGMKPGEPRDQTGRARARQARQARQLRQESN